MNRLIMLLCVMLILLFVNACDKRDYSETQDKAVLPSSSETVDKIPPEPELYVSPLRHCIDRALGGHAPALYELSAFADEVDMNLTVLYKAAGSRDPSDYSGDYWTWAYDGQYSHYAELGAKRNLVDALLNLWDSGNDPIANNLRSSVCSHEHFPTEFMEALMKTSYTYSYHAFAEEHGIQPNRGAEDVANIRFAPYDTSEPEYGYVEGMAERYLEHVVEYGSQFYEYDFDGCGENEIGIPIHSGAGGAFSFDGFAIFKKNDDGLYESYAGGPDYLFADAKRIIRFDEKVYFIVNPYSTTGSNRHDIRAYTIDRYGMMHGMAIAGKDFTLQKVITYTAEAYAGGFNALLSEIETQAREAAAMTKEQKLYSPNDENRLPFTADDDLWESQYASDIGIQVESNGNLHDLFPIGDNIVQFWTHEYNGATYCVSLQQYDLLYTLQIYVIQSGEAALVSKSLFFDEMQDIEISFSQ